MNYYLLLTLLIKKYLLSKKKKSIQNLEDLMKINLKLNHFYIEFTKSYIYNISKFFISLILIFILILNNLKTYFFNNKK